MCILYISWICQWNSITERCTTSFTPYSNVSAFEIGYNETSAIEVDDGSCKMS